MHLSETQNVGLVANRCDVEADHILGAAFRVDRRTAKLPNRAHQRVAVSLVLALKHKRKIKHRSL